MFGAALSQFVEAYNLHQDKELAAQFAENRAAYSAAKATFVQQILAAAAYPNAAE